MRIVARQASRFIKDGQMLDLRDVVEELWATFLEETDFKREAANLQEFALLNKDVAFIGMSEACIRSCAVRASWSWSTSTAFQSTTSRSCAMQATTWQEIGEKILDNYATQVLDFGFFHADPHPGNMLVRDGKIVYIDLGMMGRLSPRDRAGFGAIINAVGMQSASELKDALLAFAIQRDNNGHRPYAFSGRS